MTVGRRPGASGPSYQAAAHPSQNEFSVFKRIRTSAVVAMVVLAILTVVTPAGAQVVDLFNNFNTDAVSNGVTMGTMFTLNTPAQITELVTYHWNSGQGTPGYVGNIAIFAPNGRQIGTAWPAPAQAGQGGLPVNWVANPINFYLPAGTYIVDDSQHATWSQNAKSGHRGFAIVRGTPVASIPPGRNPITGLQNPPPSPSTPASAGWPYTCDTNAGAVAHMVGICTGDWRSATITIVMLRTLSVPIRSVLFKFTKAGVNNPVTLPANVVLPNVCNMATAGGSCQIKGLLHQLCLGGQYSTWDVYPIDRNSVPHGDIGRFMIGGCP